MANRRKYARVAVLLCAAAMLVLQGCGGDDGDAERGLQEQIDMLTAERDAALTAQSAAEAAQAAAMEAQAEAEAAQEAAEMERDAANTARGAAMEAQATAEAAAAAAMEAQTAAEAAQAAAEMAQAEAETMQATAETERDAAVAAQTAAEMARDAAVMAQQTAAAAQATAEAERDAAMEAQMAAEEAQAMAEAARMAAEMARDAARTAEAEARAAQAAAEATQTADAEALAAAKAEAETAKDAAAAAMVAQATAEAAQATAERDRDAAMQAQTDAEAAAEKAAMDAEAAKMAADDAVAAAMDAQEKAEMARDDAMKAQMDAEMARDDAMKAQTDAETERDNYKKMADDAAKAQMDAETARDAALKAQTDAEKARDDALKARDDALTAQKAAEDALAELRGDIDTGETVDANAAAKALLGVLANNNVAFTVPAGVAGATRTATTADEVHNNSGLSGIVTVAATDDAATADVNEAAVERQRVANDVSALMVEVSSDGTLMAEVEDVAAYKMSDTTPDMIEGWRGAMLTRGTTTVDTVVVYSNIGDDGMESLLDRYESTRPTTTEPRKWTLTVLAALDGDPPDANVNQIPWSEVERPDSETAFAGTGDAPMLTFKGTVHDIPGTFSCPHTTADPCSAPGRYSDGKVNPLAFDGTTNADGADGTWMFVPDEGVSLFTDDETYLTFGWWLDKNAAGNPTDFLAFSTASAKMGPARNGGTEANGTESTTRGGGIRGTPTAAGTWGTYLRGSATYEGAAAGKYATASTASADYEGGHFTADAMLTVNFDADLDGNSDTAGNNTSGIAVSGMIDNFMTGSTARPDWSVKLMVDNDNSRATTARPVKSLVQEAADTADMREMLTSWSTGGAAKGEGTWDAKWYGGVTYEAGSGSETGLTGIGPNDDVVDVIGVPTAVVGTFNANIGEAARLQGAFGAMKED